MVVTLQIIMTRLPAVFLYTLMGVVLGVGIFGVAAKLSAGWF